MVLAIVVQELPQHLLLIFIHFVLDECGIALRALKSFFLTFFFIVLKVPEITLQFGILYLVLLVLLFALLQVLLLTVIIIQIKLANLVLEPFVAVENLIQDHAALIIVEAQHFYEGLLVLVQDLHRAA